jgi:hypothetical protein
MEQIISTPGAEYSNLWSRLFRHLEQIIPTPGQVIPTPGADYSNIWRVDYVFLHKRTRFILSGLESFNALC